MLPDLILSSCLARFFLTGYPPRGYRSNVNDSVLDAINGSVELETCILPLVPAPGWTNGNSRRELGVGTVAVATLARFLVDVNGPVILGICVLPLVSALSGPITSAQQRRDPLEEA